MKPEFQNRIVSIVLFILFLGGVFWLFQKPLIPVPLQSPDVSATPADTKEKNIIILSPQPGDKVTNPIHVTGKARVFEATYNYRVIDATNRILTEGAAMTTGASVPDYGDIDIQIPVSYWEPTVVSGGGSPLALTLEVFEYSAKDGEVVNLVRVPVELASGETSKVKIYYVNPVKNKTSDCEVVYPVERTVYKTQQIGFITLHELMQVPTDEEYDAGYMNTLPEEFKVNSLVIRDGTANADFQNWGPPPAGSCNVLAIRSQIENTLKQFPSVKNVVISVNGRTDEALQP